MEFGKNRVQFSNFYWNYHRYEKYDIYFNEYGQQLAKYTANYIEKEIDRLENYFDYHIDNRIIFIVYNKLSDFRQSNIGLVSGKVESNIGGTIQIDKNKVFIYFEGDYAKFENQITGAICNVLIMDLIYGNGLRDNATNSTLINLPDWYTDGLISFVSKGWTIEAENKIKDGILTGKYKKFNRLEGEDAKWAGHSFWRYITENYGNSIIPSILYLTKINKNANSGFFYVVGSPLKHLSKDWYQHYYDQFSKQEADKTLPEDKPIIKKPRKKRVYQQMKISPSGKHIAFVTNYMGKYKIFVFNTETQKKKKLLRREHKLEQITDYSYPVVAWHPSGRYLTFITEEQGGLKMYYYLFEDQSLTSRNVLYFEKVLSYSFSPDGSLMAISAVKNGQSDIYIHNIAAGSNFQVTNDIADDFHPQFIDNGQKIMFSSTRETDSLSTESQLNSRSFTQDLFIYDYSNKSEKLKRLSNVKYIAKTHPYEIGTNKFISLSDRNGIINRYYSKFDSTISSVDTAIHYQYFASTYPVTNYSRNINEQNYNLKSNTLNEIVYNKGRYFMFSRELAPKEIEEKEIEPTAFRNQLSKTLQERDSIAKIEVVTISLDSLLTHGLITETDTINIKDDHIDINNYIFEIEKINILNEEFKNKNLNIVVVDEEKTKKPKTLIYQKAFYQNYLVSQIDFSFLDESYQPFTGGAVYFNPGTNVLFKVGTHDLFEDYKLTAGLRLPIDFASSEYLISFENLKHRLNKQFFFHRQTFSTVSYSDVVNEVKNITNEVTVVFRWPFSQVTSVAGTIGARDDKAILIPNPLVSSTLDEKSINKLWINTKGEYIFDNTRTLGLNLPAGTRFKIFAEYHQRINKNYENLFVFGGDFRHYTVIHRNFIWANRFAMSGSTGKARLIYYLGGVDNWTNFSSETPTFIPLSEIRLTPDVNYVYQTVATNMRGFSQNIRNGSNFALINSELRLPIIRYLANYPLSNAFFENFTVVGFFDIGTAWSGLSPWAKENGYDRDFIQKAHVEIEIDAQRDPIVAGYGFGLRSQLLGYFIRLDWAWGIENMQVLPHVFYFSLALDF
jgi:Tol biopolymer transport system component